MKDQKIEMTDQTYEIVHGMRREDETFEDTLKRLALAFRASGLMSYDPTPERKKSASR